jgi:pheromone shutdown protein TraB
VLVLRNPSTNALVYVVGTAHIGDSKDDVARVIRQTQPNAVVVELCSSRSSLLHTSTGEDIPPSTFENGLDVFDTAKDAAEVMLDWSHLISLM